MAWYGDGRRWLMGAFAGLFWGAYEYQKWSSCKAGIEFVFNKDVLIAQEPPCNLQHALYSHRLDCDAVRKDTDVTMFYSNVAQCFFEKHFLFTPLGFGLTLLFVAFLLRHSVHSYWKERKYQQQMRAFEAARRQGAWPELLALPASREAPELVPRKYKK